MSCAVQSAIAHLLSNPLPPAPPQVIEVKVPRQQQAPVAPPSLPSGLLEALLRPPKQPSPPSDDESDEEVPPKRSPRPRPLQRDRPLPPVQHAHEDFEPAHHPEPSEPTHRSRTTTPMFDHAQGSIRPHSRPRRPSSSASEWPEEVVEARLPAQQQFHSMPHVEGLALNLEPHQPRYEPHRVDEYVHRAPVRFTYTALMNRSRIRST